MLVLLRLLEIAVQTNLSKAMRKGNRREKVCRCSGAKNICIALAEHRNYCQASILRSRYRRKMKNRLPLKNYRRMAIPPRLCPPKKTLPTTTLEISNTSLGFLISRNAYEL